MNATPIRLLLVEDNAADELLLRHALAEAGEPAFDITHVELMADAVKCLHEQEFDAILLDLSLPDSQGIGTIAKVNAAASTIPIIVMTGLDDEAVAVEAVRRGAQDFLIKGGADARALVRPIRYAIERKQNEEALRRLNETLEQRVAERTATATRRAAQLQALAVELTQTEHRERHRLAKFLHDHLQQLLYAARLTMNSLRKPDITESERIETLEQVDALLGECIAESRTLTVQLCPPVLHEAGLAAGLEWLGRHMGQTCGLCVDVSIDPQAEPESEEIRILLFEATRELLFNVVKHAETAQARVAMTSAANGELQVVVSDEGAGFASLDPRRSDFSGFGLFSIRERLQLLGGRLEIESAPQHGTRVTINAPAHGNRNLADTEAVLA